MSSKGNMGADAVTVRLLKENDVAAADETFRVAFGTWFELPPAQTFAPGVTFKGRLMADPEGCIGAFVDGELVGFAFAPVWGSFGLLGPVAVKPDYWGKGISQKMLEQVMEYYAAKQVGQAGLSAFPDLQHLHLYKKFGYHPRFLTVFMDKSISKNQSPIAVPNWTKFSDLSQSDKVKSMAKIRDLTNSLHPGLDLSDEIEVADKLAIGNTVLVHDKDQLVGFAICHHGQGSEAETDGCYIKFGAVLSGPSASKHFEELLSACAAFAQSKGAKVLSCGVNTGRLEAYEAMLKHGLKVDKFTIAMHKDNEPGYSRPGLWVIDDWR